MVAEFGLDLSGLALDMTNFATFIDTGNPRAPIAQRGRPNRNAPISARRVGAVVTATAGRRDQPRLSRRPADVSQFPVASTSWWPDTRT